EAVLSILSETPPPAGRLPGPLMKAGMRPAYKTGTSYGFRDALAVGVVGGYAVLVWTGRPDGGARADQTGREASAPLLFDVFDLIQPPPARPAELLPDGAPTALTQLGSGDRQLSILFPPDQATIYVETAANTLTGGGFTPLRPLRLTARGKAPL